MSEPTTIPKRYVLAGQTVARRVPDVLARRGLTPAFSRWVMTAHAGRVWLFGALDVREVERLERYTDQALIHHLSTACDGVPVYVSNTSGLRYGFLLSQRPRLPNRAEFPGCARGAVLLGVGSADCPIAVKWDDLRHLLVAGMTRSGKSNFLRLLVHQAQAEGARLLLADLDGATFPMLAGAPALLAPIAQSPAEAHDLVARALAECDRRSLLYRQAEGYPETLAEYNGLATKRGGQGRSDATPLPRVLVILDEFNATAVALGGARGQFAGDVAALAWRGLKFGVHVVVAAQDFEKQIVGRVRDQMSAVCFRVKSRELARGVGCAGAERIAESRPGRAIGERWGLLQTYYLPKAELAAEVAPVLDEREHTLVGWALSENGGYLSLADIERSGYSQRGARQLAEDWERRGWLVKDRDAGNKRRITAELAGFAHERTNRTDRTIPAEGAQTGGPAAQTTAQTACKPVYAQ